MNEFTWRRQLRDLRVPLSPPDDLWASIEARLDQPLPSSLSAPSPDPTPMPTPAIECRWISVASIAALIVMAGGMAWHQYAIKPHATATASVQPTRPWQPIDSHYMGAAIELESAQRELRQALQVAPDSATLQRLLQRTEQQQVQLQAKERQTG